MGAIILDGAIIEDDTIIAAGTVIRPGMHIPSGIMCAGIPGKKMRDITDKERQGFTEQAAHYIEVAKDYKQVYGQI